MKLSFRLASFFLVAVLLCACHPSSSLEPGVSKTLAVDRKSRLDSLRYDLTFQLPAAKEVPVEGSVIVRFRLNKVGDVALDFRCGEFIHSMAVNGRGADDLSIADEHILVPKRLLHRGGNSIEVHFTAEDQSLNRNDDYLYTLLVPDRARTLFPCFDQPDMKALYTLTLLTPDDWVAISNTKVVSEDVNDGLKTTRFATTEPLSTYLFSFVAGHFQQTTYEAEGRLIGAYYRETDPKRLAQLPEIFRLVEASLRWQETYTGIPYPFSKYDFIVLPGFQYGGMEHTGATLYNDSRIFLSEGAGLDGELNRAELIAHETSHMWFGDLVTMRWFDDVWTKEVFANYYAAEITRELVPDADHEAVWLRTYVGAALSQDRTAGRTAIQQDLDNLNHAGLVYNNIIYDKAPVMMRKLVEQMGQEAFREGIHDYLTTYAYGNASWDDLIAILNRHTDYDIASFSRVWVKEKGLPEIRLHRSGDTLCISQHDPQGRGLLWPQQFRVALGDSTLEVDMNRAEWTVVVPKSSAQPLIPNVDGRAYGVMLPDSADLRWLLDHWRKTPNAPAALSLLQENWYAKRLTDEAWCRTLLDALAKEDDQLMCTTLIDCLTPPLRVMSHTAEVESAMLTIANRTSSFACRLRLLGTLASLSREPSTAEALLQLWKEGTLPETNAMTMAWQLALRFPTQADDILATQRNRLTDADRLRQFDYISRAADSDTAKLDSLFFSLSDAANRRIEPWTASLLSLLNHPLREHQSLRYIRPALEWLPDIQRTGDIFFPGTWCNALLIGHTSPEAYDTLQSFLTTHRDLPPMLQSKIRTASYLLERENEQHAME